MKESFKVVVTGGNKCDLKLLHRALDAVHRKHKISTLIVGERPGAEEMAYNWGIIRCIKEIITVPINKGPYRHAYDERNLNVLQYYRPNAVIIFPPFVGEPPPNNMLRVAKEKEYLVWEVPVDWRV